MNNKPDKPNQLRAAAEAQLAHDHVHAPKPRPAEELQHELQVHQIELEMQNETLRQAQVALEESRDRYMDLYEFAPVGYLTLTDKGMISEINLTGSSLLKVERNKLLHQRFASFIAQKHRDRWNHLFVSMVREPGVKSCELALKNGIGESFHAYLDCIYLVTGDKPPVVRITLTDITQLRQAEQAMREWQIFIENAHWGMAIGSLEDRTIKLANPAYARMHGYSVEELHGTKADLLYAPESRVNLPYYVECLHKDGRYSFECARLRKDGSVFPAMVDIAIIDSADGQVTTIVSVKDITARKQQEQQVRDLYAHLLTVREEEKTSMAREIHDDLGGTLTALKMESYRLAEELAAHREAAPLLEHIESMAQLIDNAVNVTRRVITGLRPTILDDFGLPTALEWQAAQFHKHSGIECRVNCVAGEGSEKKPDKIRAINLFRIFQEALTNVARHSSASRVEVEFHHGDGEILLSISDNGRGMPEKCADDPIHYGILGMTERVDQLGGRIKFGSPPGGGFSVTVSLPLPVGNTKSDNTKEGKA
ncbi:MAG: PAS domain S-box protein [Gallionella sp.]|nr:PAS domain S-box protein [Gallionella sp.]